MTTTATLTVESLLASVEQLPATGKRRLVVELLKNFDSRAILEILRQITPADSKEPVTDEEKETQAMALAMGIDLEHDENPGVQALNRIAATLREQGITYDDLMAQLKIEREKTIRTQFPSLASLLEEDTPDGATVS